MRHSGSSSSRSLDVAAVSKWLKVRGFAQYAPRFVESEINMADLARLSEKDLERLGVDDPARRARLFAEISQWKEEPSMTMQILLPAATPNVATDLPGLSKPPPARSMAAATVAVAPAAMAGIPATPPSPKIKPKKRWGAGFLFLSIAAHLLFGVFAYVYIVHVFTPKKLVFKAGPPSPNPSQKAMEHKVQMRQKQKAMSAPVPPKRVATTAQTKITLPEMPEMPALNTMTPTTMTGMGGVGTQFGAGSMMGTGGDGGGGALTMFGFRNNTGNALEGTLYDIKRDKDNQPTNFFGKGDTSVGIAADVKFVTEFTRGDWRPPESIKHYTSPVKLYNNCFFFYQMMGAEAGPCFQDPECGDGLWNAHYEGMMAAPEDGTYRFVGFADNVLCVRVNGHFVFEGSDMSYSGRRRDPRVWSAPTSMSPRGLAAYAGEWIELRKGEDVPVDVLIGDAGGLYEVGLFIEKKDAQYPKYPNGAPILPLFSVSPFSPAQLTELKKHLPDEALQGPFFQPHRGGGSSGLLNGVLK